MVKNLILSLLGLGLPLVCSVAAVNDIPVVLDLSISLNPVPVAYCHDGKPMLYVESSDFETGKETLKFFTKDLIPSTETVLSSDGYIENDVKFSKPQQIRVVTGQFSTYDLYATYTQTLFNSDEEIEYVAFCGSPTSDKWNALSVMSLTGAVVEKIELPAGYSDFSSITLYDNGPASRYLALRAYRGEDGETLFYHIDNAENSVGYVMSIPDAISVTVNDGTISVKMRETSNVDYACLYDDAGRLLHSSAVIEGRATFSSAALMPGVYIVCVGSDNVKFLYR